RNEPRWRSIRQPSTLMLEITKQLAKESSWWLGRLILSLSARPLNGACRNSDCTRKIDKTFSQPSYRCTSCFNSRTMARSRRCSSIRLAGRNRFRLFAWTHPADINSLGDDANSRCREDTIVPHASMGHNPKFYFANL